MRGISSVLPLRGPRSWDAFVGVQGSTTTQSSLVPITQFPDTLELQAVAHGEGGPQGVEAIFVLIASWIDLRHKRIELGELFARESYGDVAPE
jgi:hypothetical protein